MIALKLTDDVLFDRFHTFEERAVLAVTQGHHGKNPSVRDLAKTLGIKDDAVMKAQQDLETDFYFQIEQPRGDISFTYQLATFDRPSEFWERQTTNPRFRRSTRLEAVAPRAELYVGGVKKKWTELPRDIVKRLPKRRHGNALVFLVALAYAREQLRRGAIQIEDDALAYLLGASEKRIAAIRRLLVKAGILKFERRDHPAHVYTMPGGTPGREEDALGLRPEHTRRLSDLTIGPFSLPVFACATELDSLASEVERLSAPIALAWIAACAQYDLDLPERHDARDLLAILKPRTPKPPSAVGGLSQEPASPVGGLAPTCGGTYPDLWGDGVLLPSTSDLKILTTSGRNDEMQEQGQVQERAGEGNTGDEPIFLPPDTDLPLAVVNRGCALFQTDTLPKNVRAEFEWTWEHLRNSTGGSFSPAQEAEVIKYFLHHLAWAEETADGDRQELFATVRGTVRRLKTDDGLHAALKSARPNPADALAGLSDIFKSVPD
jgi:hypothetical protein